MQVLFLFFYLLCCGYSSEADTNEHIGEKNMNTEAILQLCVDRATNLYLLHIMGIRLEAIQGANRQRIVETESSKLFAKLCASIHHQGEEGFVLMDDLFRLCVCPTFNTYEDVKEYNALASDKEKKELISSRNILVRRNKQVKFLEQLHRTVRGYFNSYFNKAIGTLIKQDITQIQGVPSDEYFVGKILELVSVGKRDEILEISYAQEFLRELPELQGALKADLLKKLRFKGRSTLYAKTYVFYNNRRMRGTQFQGIKGLRMRILKDAKYFNNQIKMYAQAELSKYVDRSFIGENMEREITDANEDQQLYKSVLKKTDGIFDLIEGREESVERYKEVKRNKADLARTDITRETTLEERKEILDARSDFIEAVVSAVKHKDVAKTDLQFISRQLLRDTASSLGGITDNDRRAFQEYVGFLQDKDTMMDVVGDADELEELQGILENILVQNPDSTQIISDFIGAISKVNKATKKAMAEVGEHLEIINKVIEQSSDQFSPSEFDSVRELLYQRRLNKGDLSTPEILDLSDSDRRAYLSGLATGYANDFVKNEEDVERFVMGRLGNVEKLDEWRRLYKSSDPSEKAKAEEMLSDFRGRLEADLRPQRRRGRQNKSRQDVRLSASQTLLAPTNSWVSSREKDKSSKFPYAEATVPPLDVLKDAISEVRTDLSSREVTKLAKEALSENESVFLIGGLISDSDGKKKIKTALDSMKIIDRDSWFKKRDALLKKIKMDAVKEMALLRSIEELLNTDAENILTTEGVATEQDFSDMRVLTVERNIDAYTGSVPKSELVKAKEEAFRQRAVAYSASDFDRDLFEYDNDPKNNYESAKKAWKDEVEDKLKDALKILKAMGVQVDGDELELMVDNKEVPPQSETSLDDQKYAVAQRKLSAIYVALQNLDIDSGTDRLVQEYKSAASARRTFVDGLKAKYKESSAAEEIEQELSDKEMETRNELSQGIQQALENLLESRDKNEFTGARKRKMQRAQAIRSKIYEDLNAKVTEAERNLGFKNVNDVLRSAKVMDMSLASLNSLLDLSECLPTAPDPKANKILMKMYFKAVDQGLSIFADFSTGVYQSSDLKFPNDFLNAQIGLDLIKSFRRGLRSKYSPRMADHMDFFGIDNKDNTMVMPDNTFGVDALDNVLRVNKSIDGSIGSIPESFFTGAYAPILEIVQFSQDRVNVAIKGDKMTYTNEDGVKLTHSISQIQNDMKALMVERLASDFGISSADATTIIDGFQNVIEKEDQGIRIARSRLMLEWFRSAVMDLAYLSSVWALESITGDLADPDISDECLDFMDSLATDADKRKTAKKVQKALGN